MKNGYIKILALVISIVLLVSCGIIGNTNDTTDGVSPQNTQTTVDTLKIRQNIIMKNDYILKSVPGSFTNEDTILRVIPGADYKINSRQDIYINIQSSNNSGWIPEWYVKNDGMVSSFKDKTVLLVASKTNLYIAPDLSEENVDGLTLQAGQLVKITREFQDWYAVEFVQYEAGNPGERWIKKDVTIPFNTEKCMEGIVKAGAIIYNDDFTIREMESFDNNPVIINKKLIDSNSNEVYYEVTGASGFDGLIKESDFIPGPFKG